MRRLRLAALLAASLAGGCSSSTSTYICCYDWNGNTGSWSCPTQDAYTTCCGATPTTQPGCINSPGTCSTVAQSECPLGSLNPRP